ncbi:tyrosine recombinase XerC [Prosthecobacter sp.]|jgi:integrase|uniref:tyrosine recombinase XerC n=1 Tax=Prosthecobacter sp. TaxID=1965333 RepID=UPI003784803D
MPRASITLKKVKHPRYKFRVTFKQGDEYKQRYFTARTGPDGADAFMNEKKVELLNEGRKHGEFTTEERKAVIRSRELAEGFAAAGVKGFSLDAALAFYAEHLHLRRRSVSVLTAYDEFFETRRNEGVSAVHLRDFTYRLERFAKKHAKRLVAEITTKDVDAWIFGLKNAPQSKDKHRRLLHNFFGYCAGRGYTDENPVARAAKVKVIRRPPGILTPADTAALLAVSPAEIVPALAIGFFAGLRTAEIERLDWSEINLKRGFIEVTAEDAKSSQRRLVEITPNLRAWLEPHARLSGPVRLTEMRHRDRFNLARKVADVAWPANACRHSFASYHLALHQDAAKTALQLGHTNTAVLFQHYRELTTPEDAKTFFAITPESARPVNVICMSSAA